MIEMPWDNYKKYDTGKMIGGIYKKGRLKGQEEVIEVLQDLLKVSDKNNFEKIMERISIMESDIQDIKRHLRIDVIQKTVA
jgi:hypothetical protein